MPHVLTAATRARQPVSAVVFDLDRFEALNDRHGHAIGEAVLAGLGRIWRVDLRPGDLLARIGGEEFLLLLPDADRDNARAIAERMVARVRERTSPLAGNTWPVQVPALPCWPCRSRTHRRRTSVGQARMRRRTQRLARTRVGRQGRLRRQVLVMTVVARRCARRLARPRDS